METFAEVAGDLEKSLDLDQCEVEAADELTAYWLAQLGKLRCVASTGINLELTAEDYGLDKETSAKRPGQPVNYEAQWREANENALHSGDEQSSEMQVVEGQPLRQIQKQSITLSADKSEQEKYRTSCFRNAKWSPDGSTILASDYARTLQTFLIRPNENESHKAGPLRSYTTFDYHSPIYDFAPYPYYNVQDPTSTLVLTSIKDQPLRLCNTITKATVAAYLLINTNTEAYITPTSLAFFPDGTHFVTGSDCQISIFDVSHTNSGPASIHRTIPSKNDIRKGGGVGFKGQISSLAISNTGVLATGSWTRYVGLYSDCGAGESISYWSLAGYASGDPRRGSGVSQVFWSPCGRYLYVAERQSDAALIYDVRYLSECVSWLQGRNAMTNQKLSSDIFPTAEGGHEIWAGGMDGKVRVWRNPWEKEGAVDCDFVWEVDDDPIAATCIHPTGMMIATASGALNVVDEDYESDEEATSSDETDSEIESDESDDETSEEDSSTDSESESASTLHSLRKEGRVIRLRPRVSERGCLKIWQF